MTGQRRDAARDRVLRAARGAPRLPLAQIAARAGCHPDTARRHLADAGRWPPAVAVLAKQETPLTHSEQRKLARLAESLDSGDLLSERIEVIAARRKNCPLAMLNKFATSRDPELRAAVAAHPDCDPCLLRRLAADPDSHVRAVVAANPSTPTAAVVALAQDHGVGVRPAPPADPGGRVRAAAAENRWCPRRALMRLAAGPNISVRAAAASNRSCPKRLLYQLARDPSGFVRTAVAANPAAVGEELVLLAGDDDRDVRWEVACKLSGPHGRTVPDETVLALLEAPGTEVSAAAQRRASGLRSRS